MSCGASESASRDATAFSRPGGQAYLSDRTRESQPTVTQDRDLRVLGPSHWLPIVSPSESAEPEKRYPQSSSPPAQ